MSSLTLPPFPAELPVHDLLVVDFKLLKAGDKAEAEALWQAATTKGFWYLKNHKAEDFVEPMFKMGRETLALPLEDKMKYWQGNQGASFGYRASGSTYTDVDGSTDIAEFINVSKDDAMAYPKVAHRVYPPTVNIYMNQVVRPFIQACLETSRVLMDVFNQKLQLPPDTLAELHRPEKECISESRCIKMPPPSKNTKIALGAHTDYGSISFLVNRLGGLQVLASNGDSGDWQYVKPIEGHTICNIGDTLSILSGGILKSCIHRVVPPPGDQAKYERWSLVYFARPTNDVHLEALSNKSLLIADALKSAEKSTYAPGVTAAEWFAMKQTQHRTDSNKGVGTIQTYGPKVA